MPSYDENSVLTLAGLKTALTRAKARGRGRDASAAYRADRDHRGRGGITFSRKAIARFVPAPTLPSAVKPCAFCHAVIFEMVPVPIFPSTVAPTTRCTAA